MRLSASFALDWAFAVNVALAVLAAWAIGIGATRPGDPLLGSLAMGLALAGAAYAAGQPTVALWLRQRPGLALIFLGAFTLTPLPMDGLLRAVRGAGAPLEVVLLFCLRNGLFACALLPTLGRSPVGQPNWVAVAGGAAGCLAALALPNGQPAVPWLAGLYLTLAGCLVAWRTWLDDTKGEVSWLRAPWLPMAGLAAVSVAVAYLITPTTWNSNPPLAQWLASSGGTDRYDPSAQGGVGSQGTDQVDAQNDADSDGGQGNVYIESHLPSFYDVINEMAGEPFIPKHRNHAVVPQNASVQNKAAHARHHQAARKFSIYRQAPRRGPKASDLEANALLYVRGSTPLYLPMTTYVRFEGEEWVEQTQAVTTTYLVKGTNKWLDVVPTRVVWRESARDGDSVVGGSSYHSFKIGQFRSDRMPLPAGTDQFRCGLAHETHLFRVLADGGVGVAGESGLVPPGETVETYSRAVRPSLLREQADPFAIPPGISAHTAEILQPLGEETNVPQLAELANAWTETAATPWLKAEAIAARLQSADFTLDTWAKASGEKDAVLEFLTETRRGPDYLFASAAVSLLRALKIPCRLVSGYYVDPERFDAYTAATPVLAKDLHFWVEVLVAGQYWATLEATPGYRLPAEVPTWRQWLATLASDSLRWCRDHWIFCSTVVLAVLALIARRRWVANLLATAAWHLTLIRSPSTQLAWTLWLLERRARWSGTARPPSRTLRSWYRADRLPTTAAQAALVRVLDAADCLLYGDGQVSPKVTADCQTVVHTWHAPIRWGAPAQGAGAGAADSSPAPALATSPTLQPSADQKPIREHADSDPVAVGQPHRSRFL